MSANVFAVDDEAQTIQFLFTLVKLVSTVRIVEVMLRLHHLL